MGKIIDITGNRYGRWTVERYAGQRNHLTLWQCRCSCGAVKIQQKSNLISGQSKSCGCLKREYLDNYPTGNQHPSWTGGSWINKDGYRLIYTRPNTYVFEHRLVMEEDIGRSLKENEYVHHKNGQRKDNRLENLELWCTAQPKGQRPEDLVKFAKEILKQYGASHDTGTD